MTNHDELFFWFDQPPKVSKGAFNYVSEHWGNKVFYMVAHEFPEHRKKLGWDDGDYGSAEIIYLSKQRNEKEFIKEIFNEHPNAIHVLNGFFSCVESKIRECVQRTNVKLVVHTERPFIVKKAETIKQLCKNIYLPYKYRHKRKEYDKYVKALIPLGKMGVELFEKIGWEKDKMFPFMYCPVLTELNQTEAKVSKPLRFLYVGRFDRKRMKLLEKAVGSICLSNWQLDMVGGYGDYAEEMKEWISTQTKVSFLGKWDASLVGRKMQDYDVYLLPTKCDGWNAQINEVINAGMATISTDEAVSDELVSSSNSGIVVSASKWKKFAKAMEETIQNPNKVVAWKENAIAYRNKIKPDAVGEYFIDILDYTFYGLKTRPKCPWL